jgi:hypothetical protein
VILRKNSDRFLRLERSCKMKRTKRLLVVLAVAVAVLTTFVPVASSAQANKTYVSGLECAYTGIPGQAVVRGQTMHIRDQVGQNLFFSDDAATFPNSDVTARLDITINMVTSKMTVFAAQIVVQPEGAAGTWQGHGAMLIDPLRGTGHGHGVLHGTGDFAGQTMVVDATPGNPAQCPGTPVATWRWRAFIVPAVP